MSVLIDARYCGPPTSANGGYSCGLLAQHLPGAVEVTLKSPPPLGVALSVESDGRAARLLHGPQLIAEARSAALDAVPPSPPSFDAAVAAAAHYAGFSGHDYPTCFTCGPARAAHDGLRIFSGAWRNGIVAAPWVADATLADAQGRLPPPVLWAAMDCPGYWAVVGTAQPRPPMLLGRMTAQVVGGVEVGERCVVIGWPLGVDGRKYFAGTALFGADGRCVGRSRQVWIALKRGE